MPRYVNPHLDFYIRADSIVAEGQVPPEEPSMQELRRVYNLGLYTVEELEELLDEIASTLAEWVGNHPPHE
jgi:hypothetical protein